MVDKKTNYKKNVQIEFVKKTTVYAFGSVLSEGPCKSLFTQNNTKHSSLDVLMKSLNIPWLQTAVWNNSAPACVKKH